MDERNPNEALWAEYGRQVQAWLAGGGLPDQIQENEGAQRRKRAEEEDKRWRIAVTQVAQFVSGQDWDEWWSSFKRHIPRGCESDEEA